MFSVEHAAFIPAMDKIPLTPEEKQRRKKMTIAGAVAAVVVFIIAIFVVRAMWHSASVSSAIADASDTGRIEAFQDAIVLIGDDDPALRARLVAAFMLEGASGTAGQVNALLTQAGSDDAVDQQLARAYLALGQGDPAAAGHQVSNLVPTGDAAAEISRARALVALAVGNLDPALTSATLAADESGGAPRHVALVALLTARLGNVGGATTALAGFDEGEDDPLAVQAARARVLLGSLDQHAGAVAAASIVIAAEEANPAEKAWAHLTRAIVASVAGERPTARTEVAEAAGAAPPGDEMFKLRLAEVYLRLGQVEPAEAALTGLPAGASTDRDYRAHLTAMVALDKGQHGAAAQVIASATDSARTALIRARIADARDAPDQARPLFRRAAQDASLRSEAMSRLAELELRRGNPRAAVAAAEQVLATSPTHPEYVPVAVHALIAAGDRGRALHVADTALAAHSDNARLLEAKADVLMASNQWQPALVTLRAAAAIDAQDADLQGKLGKAALQTDHDDEARRAFEAALALDSRHPLGLVGMLHLAVNAEQPTEGRALIARIDEAGVTTADLDMLRARYLVQDVIGHRGERVIRRMLRARRQSEELWLLLGELQLQAGSFTAAVQSFNRVGRINEANHNARLGRLLSYARLGRARPTEDDIEALHAVEAQLSPRQKARFIVARGFLQLADNRVPRAMARAREALALDARNGHAQLLRAQAAEEAGRDATEHLRAATRSRTPPPQAMMMYVLGETASPETCEIGRRALRAAPRIRISQDLRRWLRGCQ